MSCFIAYWLLSAWMHLVLILDRVHASMRTRMRVWMNRKKNVAFIFLKFLIFVSMFLWFFFDCMFVTLLFFRCFHFYLSIYSWNASGKRQFIAQDYRKKNIFTVCFSFITFSFYPPLALFLSLSLLYFRHSLIFPMFLSFLLFCIRFLYQFSDLISFYGYLAPLFYLFYGYFS